MVDCLLRSRNFDTDGHIFVTLFRQIDDVRDFRTESFATLNGRRGSWRGASKGGTEQFTTVNH
jgi:hypothetical protein